MLSFYNKNGISEYVQTHITLYCHFHGDQYPPLIIFRAVPMLRQEFNLRILGSLVEPKDQV